MSAVVCTDVEAWTIILGLKYSPGQLGACPVQASDESNATTGKRLDSVGVENTETNRRDWRELLYTAPGGFHRLQTSCLRALPSV